MLYARPVIARAPRPLLPATPFRALRLGCAAAAPPSLTRRPSTHLGATAPARAFHASPAAMGIKQLTKLLNEHCPAAIKEGTLNDLNGRKIAIDASMVRRAHPGRRGGRSHAAPTTRDRCRGL